MSDERKEIPSEVGPIVEAAIDKIYKMLLLNDPDGRQHVVALIRTYIDGKYFSMPEFLSNQLGSTASNVALKLLKGEMDLGVLRGVVHDQINFARSQTVNIVDSVLKGEMDLEATKEKARSFLNVMGGFSRRPRRKVRSPTQRTCTCFFTTNIAANRVCRRRNLSGASSS